MIVPEVMFCLIYNSASTNISISEKITLTTYYSGLAYCKTPVEPHQTIEHCLTGLDRILAISAMIAITMLISFYLKIDYFILTSLACESRRP
jgi:hypothetical protein